MNFGRKKSYVKAELQREIIIISNNNGYDRDGMRQRYG